jgi:hypothetical protein
MAKRSKKPRKQQIPIDAASIARHKKRFIAALMTGRSPGPAAKKAGIARSTAYDWKREDPAFDAAWQNAVAHSLDKIETDVYDDQSLQAKLATLHARHPDWRKQSDGSRTSNYILSITMAEHYKRLERLGLPVPVIESDVIEDYAAEDADRS